MSKWRQFWKDVFSTEPVVFLRIRSAEGKRSSDLFPASQEEVDEIIKKAKDKRDEYEALRKEKDDEL